MKAGQNENMICQRLQILPRFDSIKTTQRSQTIKHFVFHCRTCSPAESPVRSPLPSATPPPPNNRMSMPTFNVITATPTHSMGRLSPEREAESIQNNNNIIISATVAVEDVKLQKPSDNFEETCSNTTCPEKPKLM